MSLTRIVLIVLISNASTKGMGDNDCEEGWYFDPNLPGCDRCDQMCPRATIEELPRACLDFCGRETTTVTHGELSTSSSAMSTAAIIVIALLSIIMTVAAIGLVIVKKIKIPESWRIWKKKPPVKSPVQETQGQGEHDILFEGENESLDQQEDISLHDLQDGNMV